MQMYQSSETVTNTNDFIFQADNEFLILIVHYPIFLETTVVKSEYLKSEAKIMFDILKEEYNSKKEFVLENLGKHKNFDSKYFAELISVDIFYSSKDIKFREVEKYLIDRYKIEMYKQLTTTFDGDCNKLYEDLTKINQIDYNETDYIKAKDIYNALATKNNKIKLGYTYLDASLQLMETDLLIVGAGTGVGKTSFAINLLTNLSKEYQCIYFNMEMSATILYKRLIANLTNITMVELNDINSLEPSKQTLIKQAMTELEDRGIILVNKTLDVKSITKIVENTKTTRKVIVFIDHLGLVKSSGTSLYEKATNTAKNLRALCINSNCTVISLCQLGREAQKKDERPTLQDLRDSGEIEQSSRKAILLYNKSANKEQRVQDIEVIIAKNDDGMKGIKNFKFDRLTQSFKEVYTER